MNKNIYINKNKYINNLKNQTNKNILIKLKI